MPPKRKRNYRSEHQAARLTRQRLWLGQEAFDKLRELACLPRSEVIPYGGLRRTCEDLIEKAYRKRKRNRNKCRRIR